MEGEMVAPFLVAQSRTEPFVVRLFVVRRRRGDRGRKRGMVVVEEEVLGRSGECRTCCKICILRSHLRSL